MVDVEAVLTEYLLDQAGLTVLTGQRIHASLYLPKGYEPSQGPALIFNIRAGSQDYSSAVFQPSIQFRAYAKTQAEAKAVDRALYDVLNDKDCYPIKMARLEVMGQLLEEPDTRWPYVLSFYRLFVGNS